LDVQGYEHLYYTQAGRYTGIFWPVTEAGVQNNLRALRVFSVEQFKTAQGVMAVPFKVKESAPPDGNDRPQTIPERIRPAGKP
jgi:hypothetical protein